MTERPQLIVLAGPNGAGKSTFHDYRLAGSPLPYLNADLLAAETGLDSLEVARFLDAERLRRVENRQGFITETVFSDPVGAKLDLMRRAVELGFDVVLIYVGIDPSLAEARIDQRIAAGGHDVPRDRLAGRFARSLANLRAALAILPAVKIYDNSSTTEPHRLIAVYEAGRRTYLAPGPLPDWIAAVIAPEPPRRKRTKKLVG